MEQPPGDSVQLKVQKTCDCGFLWAFELIHTKVSQGKKKLHLLEMKLTELLNKSRGQERNNSNLEEKQFVAVYIQNWGRYIRGYITHIVQDSKGGTYQVFLIDYGCHETVNTRDVKKLPDFASVDKLRAQAWKIAIHGVLPIHIEFNFGEQSVRRAGKQWNAKDVHFIRNVVKSDEIHFVQVEKVEEYRFGIIYVKDQMTRKYHTLQELLIQNKYAVKFENFTKVMPSIVRRFEKSADNVSFPFGEDENDPRSSISITDTPSDNESTLSLDNYESDDENEKSLSSLDQDRNEDKQIRTPVRSTPSTPPPSGPSSKPKRGRSRGEILLNLSRSSPKKSIVESPPIMLGRTPEIDQFEDYHSSRMTPKNEPVKTINLITPSPERPSILDRSVCDNSRSSKSVSYSLEMPKTNPVVSSITPPPEKPSTPRGAGRGAMLKKLKECYSPSSSSGSSDDGNYSLPRPTKGNGNDLSSDIVELSPLSNTIVDIRAPIPPPESILISSTESQPETQTSTSSTSTGNRSPETILISSTESVHKSIDVSKNTPKFKKTEASSSVESLPREDMPLDPQEIACRNMLDEEIALQRTLLDKILIVGDVKFQPYYRLKDHDINAEIQERLQQLRIQDLIRCQHYMIPAMLTRRHITLIDGPQSGKTLSCMIGLLTALKDEKFYAKLAKGPGPKAIILCPYASRCEWIYQQCHEITKRRYDSYIEGENVKINVAYGCGKELEKEKLDELVKGYDVVICTPPCLLRLLEIPEMFNFKRLCHLVLDEAHILLDSYTEETIEIMRRAYEVGKKTETGLILPQRVIISNSWLPKIRQMVKDDVIKGQGVALLSSYLEAAIFCNVKASLKYLDDCTKKLHDVVDYLSTDAACKKVVIVFDDSQDFYEIFTWLKSNCARPMYMLSNNHALFDEEVADWKKDCMNGRYPVMLCNDFVLSDLRINEANCLIHYGLPDKKSTFSRRFSVILDGLNVPQEYLKEGVKSPASSQAETMIYLSSDNCDQFSTIVNLMERLHASIPREVKNISNKLKHVRELQKGDVQVCENFKKFARCQNESQCEYRHSFFLEYDQPDADIPHDGLVKVHVVQVYSATHFCVRLLEHKTGTDPWTRITSISHPHVVNAKVKRYFSEVENRAPPLSSSVGDVVAIETAPRTYERAKITKLVENEKSKNKRTVVVKFLENGKIMDVRETVLLKLSEELAKIPPTTVDVFLCNLLPVDRDIEWGDAITYRVKRNIQQMQEDSQKFFVGKIKLVAGRDLWLNPFECKQWYPSIEEYTTVHSVFRNLLREKMAVVNNEHLSKLQQTYEWAGFSLPDGALEMQTSISLSPVKSNSKSSPKPNPVGESPKSEPVEESAKLEVKLEEESRYREEIIHDPATQILKSVLGISSTEDDRGSEQNDDRESEENIENDSASHSEPDDEVSSSSQSGLELVEKKLDELDLGLPSPDDTFDMNFTEKELKMMIKHIMPGILPNSESDEESPAPTKIIIKPNVDWRQDVAYIYIIVYLNTDDYRVRFTTDSVYFRANFDDKTYEFNEQLYAAVDPNKSTHHKSGVTIAIKMEKLVKRNKWSRLLKRKDVQHWVKMNKDYLDDDDVQIPDEYFPEKLCLPTAFIDQIKTEFKPFERSNLPIYPDGYEDDDDSESDSDAYGDRLEEYCDD